MAGAGADDAVRYHQRDNPLFAHVHRGEEAGEVLGIDGKHHHAGEVSLPVHDLAGELDAPLFGDSSDHQASNSSMPAVAGYVPGQV